jgi:AraC-like DNA-binding protein
VTTHRGRNVTSDCALVERVSPFIGRIGGDGRAAVTFVLRGRGRLDEGERRGWVDDRSFVASHLGRFGTEAFGGVHTDVLALEWDPKVLGAPHGGAFVVERLASADRARLRDVVAGLRGPDPTSAVLRVFDFLISLGFPLRRPEAGELRGKPDPREELAMRVHAACSVALSSLPTRPAIEDIVSAFGTNPRQVHRLLGIVAERYRLPWAHWRGALHHMRLAHALRLLSAPGATTELVARCTGFRSPTALCHALAKGGLPSPGALARAAAKDALESWTAFARPNRSVAADSESLVVHGRADARVSP